MSERCVGVIGGSGLYEMEGLADLREVRVRTPFGDPSDAILCGELRSPHGDVRLAFLPRHGRGHRYSPSTIPYRANLWALKSLGCTEILSVSAVGSMREDLHPGDFVIVDQFFDRTMGRASTFFGTGLVAHVMFADPLCKELGDLLYEQGRALSIPIHRGGTYLCMEGPAFSTRAESRIYRQWGVDVIGMTNLTEAKLAREAEISYATIAMVTDYDCWHEEHDAVTVDAVVAVMRSNVGKAKALLAATAPRLARPLACACKDALKSAIMTHREAIDPALAEALRPIVGRYLGG
ncbi:MAG: S-methyl-5'-thioadenosine phosphorylase [Planctomycetes bacterium]|nr:S-methyl-5'-thioadenosine phosphorylase [Planctomycetota bacterium]